MYQIITFSRITLTTLVIVVCVGGDWLVELNSNSPIGKAAFDNITHAIVGLLSAAILFIQVEQRFSSFERIAAIATCFSISSLIDIDHFIVARTWTLSNATHLQHRPFLHCTTIPLVLLVAILFLDKFRHKVWCAVIVCAFLSHHTRDATRRGYWIWPLGHTKPVPYVLYILLTQLIPFVIAHILNSSYHGSSGDRIAYTNINNVTIV